MNVDDVRSVESDGDMLASMFKRQRELMIKYHDIEKRNGVGSGAILPDVFNIDDPRCQYICKDFAWRVTEELVEAMDADPTHQAHVWEEAADALHFLLELLIMNGIDDEKFLSELKQIEPYATRIKFHHDLGYRMEDHLSSIYDAITSAMDPIRDAWAVVRELGRAMNCLKNKPWKQTHMETDVLKYQRHLIMSLVRWIAFARSLKMTAMNIYDLYFRKSEVNKFRIKSSY